MLNPLYESFFQKNHSSEKIFLLLKNNNKISYKDFICLIEKTSFFFKEKGLIPGDRVALKLKKSHHFLAIYGACIRNGLIFLPLNNSYTTEELTYFLNDSESKLLITDSETFLNLKNKKFHHSLFIEILEPDGSGFIKDNLTNRVNYERPVKRQLNDVAAILYTSGTTGKSKGAMITQENLISNAKTLKDYWNFTPHDNLIHSLPIYHTHGLFVATNIILLSSAKMIFLEKFDIDELINFLPIATVLMGVPTYYSRLLDSKKLTKLLVKNIRLFISGSAPLTKEINDEFFKKTGKKILERYGMTETNMISSNPYYGERISGTVGYPLPNINVRIIDSCSGKLLSKGKIGEIQVKGKNVFKGYWRMSDKTANSFTKDGFFKTEDLGFFDKNGYLEIVGRLKDLIISGGFNIYPKEIENVINSIKGIKESAVIGIPHRDLGEAVFSIIIREKESKLNSKKISDFMNKKLAKYKCPKAIIFKDSLPKNNLGKILKNKLREEYFNFFKK